MPVNREALLKDLKQQVRLLEDDLRERTQEPEFPRALYGQWDKAFKAKRVSRTYESWLEGQITQAAVGWVLGTVFVRFCEDNDLLDEAWISGPGEKLERASDREHAWYLSGDTEWRATMTPRDWLLETFAHMRRVNPDVGALFNEEHNLLYKITLSREAARALLNFWRQPGEDGGVIHEFTDEELDTRFLGDLYQDLSEYAQKTFALLQTPEFVEEFILDRTMTPALKEFGPAPAYPLPIDRERRGLPELPDVLRVIDPTCGSGHFLLGAFKRLLEAWEKSNLSNRMTRTEVIARVLTGIHGVDKNPFAAAIARFRLLIAATKANGIQKLKDMPNWQINVAVGDSLLHGRGVLHSKKEERLAADGLFAELDEDTEDEIYTFESEDVREYIRTVDILGNGSYHVVVGNPPYITVKDKAESVLYKKRYDSCYQKYSLSVPFAERFFKLGVRGEHIRGSGVIGQITANSFMKREFGKKLIEEFFWTPPQKKEHQAVHLTEVVDTSGAYIPGHGTPTAILIGRNTFPRLEEPIRAVLGIRGEPAIPEDPSKGNVWLSIVGQIEYPGSESEWTSSSDLQRRVFAKHPWAIGGGGAGDLLGQIEKASGSKLGSIIDSAGVTAVTGEDDLYILPLDGAAERLKIEETKPLVTGDVIRDFDLRATCSAIWVYDKDLKPVRLEDLGRRERILSKYRSAISHRRRFGVPMIKRGLKWYEWQELYSSKFKNPLSIAFAFVATHNHFALDRGGNIFNRTAPVIKLPEGSTEKEHLELLGVLNSSAACFWLKQVSQNRGSTVDAQGARQTTVPWDNFYEYTGTNMQRFPLPAKYPYEIAMRLDRLAQKLSKTEPIESCTMNTLMADQLSEARRENESIRRRMITFQEEMDWQVYGNYGLIEESEARDLIAVNSEDLPDIDLGERAFEIVMARNMKAGKLETEWFKRHRSTPITEIPSRWPVWYQDLVERRILKITADRNIGLIERPEFKRRWSHEPWDKRQKEALRNSILDACEDRSLWFDSHGRATTRTVYNLADALRERPEVVEAARLYDSTANADLTKVLVEIIESEHVPFISKLRFKPSGLNKHAQWVTTWEKQCEEDETGEDLKIPVPPKYTSADFLKASYWRHRGKLDVPKERFISYPGASPDTDDSLLIGWAGWDHRDQAIALTQLIEDRRTKAAWGADRLIPLYLGLRELEFWLEQWHNEVDPDFGRGRDTTAQTFKVMREQGQRRLGITERDLDAWEPPKKARGRRRSKAE